MAQFMECKTNRGGTYMVNQIVIIADNMEKDAESAANTDSENEADRMIEQNNQITKQSIRWGEETIKQALKKQNQIDIDLEEVEL